MSTFFHEEKAGKVIIAAEPGELPRALEVGLWKMLEEVGSRWQFKGKSAGTRSSWLEFVSVRCETKPSYLGEYWNALKVIESLEAVPGIRDAVGELFNHTVPEKLADDSTRLDHAKRFVVDEFITVRIVAGGFREFGGRNRPYNYNGFIRGTRYNRVMRVRAYQPEKFEPSQCGRSWKGKGES
jgi:hypothetical protein